MKTLAEVQFWLESHRGVSMTIPERTTTDEWSVQFVGSSSEKIEESFSGKGDSLQEAFEAAVSWWGDL